jgi:hypothetical protein
MPGSSAASPTPLATSLAGAYHRRMQPLPNCSPFRAVFPRLFRFVNVQSREHRIHVKDIHFQRGQLIVVKVTVAQMKIYVKNEGKREKHLWNTPIHLD